MIDKKIVALLFLLSCVFFWKVVLNPGKIIFSRYFTDVISFHSSQEYFYSNSWQTFGTFPLWDPYDFMGYPFAGFPETSMFYPLSFLYLVLSPNLLFGFVFLFDIFLMGVFTYLFVSELGVEKSGSFISAIIFMFNGTLIVGAVYNGLMGDVAVLVWQPLVLLLLERAIKKQSFFYAVLTGLFMGLQFLGGNIQISVYSAFGLGLYFLLRTAFVFKSQRNLKILYKLFSYFALACVIAILLSAVKIFPVAEYTNFSERALSTNYAFGTAFSFPPEQLVTFFMPEFFGTYLDETYWGGRNFWTLTVYTGLFSLLFTVVAIMFVKNDYVKIFAILMIFSLLFAFGKYTPLYSVFYNYVPFFDLFRRPTSILTLTTFSISILSGFGFSFLTKRLNKDDEKKLLALVKIMTIVSVLTIGAILFTYLEKDYILQLGEKFLVDKYETFTTTIHSLRHDLDFYRGKIPESYNYILNSMESFLVFLGAVAFILYLRLKEKISINQFTILVVFIILLDLWYFGMKYIDIGDPSQIFSDRIPTEFLQNNSENFRILDFSKVLPQYISKRDHIELITGYGVHDLKHYRDFITFFFGDKPTVQIEPTIPINYTKLSENYASKILGLLNVKYVFTDSPLDNAGFELKSNITTYVYAQYIPTQNTKSVYVYENKNLLPRAFTVPNAKIMENGSAIFEEMKQESFDPKAYVILEKDVGTSLTNAGEFQEANVTYYSPNEIDVRVGMKTPGYLVLIENWYPGWKAYDNGNEKEIYKTDYTLRSIYLDEGKHDVKFVYDPISFKIGFWSTAITAFSLGVFIVYHQIYSKNNVGKIIKGDGD